MKFTKLGLTIAAGVGFLGLVFFGGYFVGGGFSSENIKNVKILESEKENIETTQKEINKISKKTGSNEEDVIKEFNAVLAAEETSLNTLNATINQLKSDIETFELYNKISAYHNKQTQEEYIINVGSIRWLKRKNNINLTYTKLANQVEKNLKTKAAIQGESFAKTITSLKNIFPEPPTSTSQTSSPVNQDKQRIQNGGTQERKADKTLIKEKYFRIPSQGKVDQPKKRELVEAIYDYQKIQGLKPDGIIDNGGETYNRLKQD